MTLPNKYPIGTTVRFSGQIYDINGALVDPTNVICVVSSPGGLSYQSNAVRDGTGMYHYDFITATPAGQWAYRFQGLGAVVASSGDVPFTVLFPKF